ncbi:urease accessory protein UreE [Actinomyces gaoshouyii]|uniref:urease accessory protein UreE n=1 Tax=Actinomyces gaoshouyii TaxID=1960083 RepID=UPI0009BDA5BA|nr:urease accessory protein UreE [Actinomyces gaoshouyii]ARD42053.1 Urease accessory protein UreE [Actinomyces gaoshouyii]
MIITEIVGSIGSLSPEELDSCHIERVRMPLSDLTRRIQRVRTDHGRELGIRLAPGAADLRAGDILARDERSLVVIELESTDVLVIAPATIEQMGVVAHNLGNRHLPAQFFGPEEDFEGLGGHDGVMVIQYDHTAEHYLERIGVPHIRLQRAMRVPFRHAEHTH